MATAGDRGENPSITGYWLKNNLLSAIIYCLVSIFLYGVGYATRDAETGPGFSWPYYAAGIFLWTFAGFAEGILTGAALQRILPLLPARAWVALHAVVAAVLFAGFGLLGAEDSGKPIRVDGAVIVGELMIVGMFGAVMGAAIGGLQALILRAAAVGIGSWITWSAAAYAAGMVVWMGSEALLELEPGFAAVLTRRVIDVVSAMVGAGLMLPALWGLKSRTPSLARRAL
jgi:hypothetical protein